MINVSGLNKVQVFLALYKAAECHALEDMLRSTNPADRMTEEKAETFLADNEYVIGKVDGRNMDVDLSGSQFDPGSYDEWNGKGTAKAAISRLRE